MRSSESFRFASTLIVRKLGRVSVVFVAIMVGTAAMLLFLGFANGLERVVLAPILERSSPTTLVVRPNYRTLDFVTGGKKIIEATVTEIAEIAEVEAVYRQLFLGFPNSLRISLFGVEFVTDVPVFGVDAALLEIEAARFAQNEGEALPVAISPRLLDLFNSAFADAFAGMSQLEAYDVLGREFTLIFGRSSFFNTLVGNTEPLETQARVAVISPKLPPIGVSIPLTAALEMNARFAGTPPEDAVYQQLLIETRDVAVIPTVQAKIESMGYDARSFEELGEEVRILTETIRLTLFAAALVILGIAFFALFALLTVVIVEQQRNIGILRVLGTGKAAIMTIFTFFTGTIVLGAIAGGMLLGLGGAALINAQATRMFGGISLFATDFIVFSPLLAARIAGGILVIALCFTILPLRSALKKGQLRLLWE